MAKDYACLHDGRHLAPKCTLCGKCLSVCPLVAATGREELSPRAKFHLRDSVTRRDGVALPEAALTEADAARLASLCLSCGRCEKACPSSLCGPELAAKLRARHPGWREWVWRRWLTHPEVLWPAASGAARLLPQAVVEAAAESLGRLGGYAARPLLRQLQALGQGRAIDPWLALERADACGRGRKAVLFAGCTARQAKPHWVETARALLAALGFALADIDFQCCGCSLGHAGLEAEQRAMQRANKDAWVAAGKPLLVAFCATCRCGLRSYAHVDLGWEPMDREEWLAGTVPLASLLGGSTFRALGNAPAAVRYHRPCHGSGGDQDRTFLTRALGPRLVKAGLDVCCGFGGILQLGAPELSAAVAARAWNFYDAKPGEQLVTGCSACALQLAATAPQGVAVGHWLEIVRT